MIPSVIRAVFLKELRDCLRDRRTLFASVLLPVLLYPIVFLLLGETVRHAETKRRETEYRIATAAVADAARLESWIRGEAHVEARDASSSEPSATNEPAEKIKLRFYATPDPQRALRVREADLAVFFDDDPPDCLAEDGQAKLKILYDGAESRSLHAKSALADELKEGRDRIVAQRLESRGLPQHWLQPISAEFSDQAPPEKKGGSALGTFLPLLFIMLIITGAITPAVDLTAGEKERATLETLAAEPTRPADLAVGKFLAVATLAFATAVLNVGSFGLTMIVAGLDRLPDFAFPWSALPATLLLLLPLTLFFSALLLAVGALAKTVREAQVYCVPVYLLPMLGLTTVMIPGLDLNGPLLAMPVVNSALLIRELFLGHEVGGAYAFVFVGTCLYAAVAVGVAARVFAREEILFSSAGGIRLLLRRRLIRPTQTPRMVEVLLIAALLYPLQFHFSGLLGRLGADGPNVPLLVLLPQLLLFFLTPLAAAWYLKADPRTTFRLRPPSLRALVAAVFLGGSSWLLAMQFLAWQSRLWPLLPDDLEKLTATMSLPELLFFLAVIPALCEEWFFRGFLLSGLREKLGKYGVILLTGLIFGVFHYSLQKQPLTTVLGCALAWTALKSGSLWPGIVFHFLHNGFSVWAHKNSDFMSPIVTSDKLDLRWEWSACAALLFGCGLFLLWKSKTNDAKDDVKAQFTPPR